MNFSSIQKAMAQRQTFSGNALVTKFLNLFEQP